MAGVFLRRGDDWRSVGVFVVRKFSREGEARPQAEPELG